MRNVSKQIAENLAIVRERIERAALRAGRQLGDITLIAVSKTHSAERIRECFAAGVRHFGENRVQEWESKRAALLDIDATWHMIGHVQSNKSSRVVRLFHAVDTVDSFSLAERLERAKREFIAEKTPEKSAEPLRVLIEVKLDPGPSKSGVPPEQVLQLTEAIAPLSQLKLQGLMGVPPYFNDQEEARPYFRKLRELRDALREKTGRESLPILSMGMSHDFEIAIEEGATEIRVGTALFGERTQP